MDREKSWVGPFFILAGLVGYLSQLKYGGFPMTAFEWPSIDMGPFFERIADPNFLKEDFVVNSMNASNPRWIFGYQVLFLMKTFGADWHSAFLLMKSVMVVFIPAFSFLYFIEATKSLLKKEYVNTSTLIFAFLCIVLIYFSRSMQMRISIGLYYQSELKATPHSLAIFWSLMGSLLLFKNRWFSYLFLIVGTITHPAVGFIFYCLNLVFQRGQWTLIRFGLLILFSVAIPFGILLWMFPSPNPLELSQFIEIYVKNRLPHHYDVMSWDLKGLILHMSYFVSFFSLFMYLYYDSKKEVFRAVSLALVFYVGAIFSQYFFVHVIPFKPVVLLGPVRFTAFSFFLCAPFLLCWLEEHWALRSFSIPPMRLSRNAWGVSAIILALGIFLISENRPLERLVKKSPDLYAWVQANASEDDVFVGSLDLAIDEFVLLAKRSVFISHIFPFSEELYPEYFRRWKLIHGANRAEKYQFFENQTIEGWGQIVDEEGIDYVILRSDSKSQLALVEPAFKSEKWLVISKQNIFKLLNAQQ